MPMDRSFRWTRSTRRVGSVRKGVTTHRLVVSRLNSARIGQQLCGIHHARPLKPSAKTARGDDEHRVRVAFGKRVVFGTEIRIREESQRPASQAGQQQLHQLRRIRKAQQDTISSRKTAVSQHFSKARATVMDLPMSHDVRRIVGGLVIPSRFGCPLSEKPCEVPIRHYWIAPLARHRDCAPSIARIAKRSGASPLHTNDRRSTPFLVCRSNEHSLGGWDPIVRCKICLHSLHSLFRYRATALGYCQRWPGR